MSGSLRFKQNSTHSDTLRTASRQKLYLYCSRQNLEIKKLKTSLLMETLSDSLQKNIHPYQKKYFSYKRKKVEIKAIIKNFKTLNYLLQTPTYLTNSNSTLPLAQYLPDSHILTHLPSIPDMDTSAGPVKRNLRADITHK